MGLTLTPGAVAVLGVGLVAVGYLALKTSGKTVQDVAANVTTGAISAATGAATGAVVGVGQAVGIPATDTDQCSADLAAGRTWDASFSCPAGRWLSEGVFGTSTSTSKKPTQEQPADYALDWNFIFP